MKTIAPNFGKGFLMGLFLLSFGPALQTAGLFAQQIQQANVPGNFQFVQQSVANRGIDYVVAGTVVPGPISGKSDILVLMADDAGNILWSKYVDYGYDEFAGSVMVDAQDNIVLTGYAGINGTGTKNLVVVKLDGNGNYVDDVGIADSGLFGYGLYGMDLEQDSHGNYSIVGTGVDDATVAADKYAFALQLGINLGVINWGKIYQSSGVPTTNFDSFNHILRVFHPVYGESFLLTGSGVTNVFPNHQTVVNDLIAPGTGASFWPSATATRETTSCCNQYDNPGVTALYNQNLDEFFVLYYGRENIPELFTINGTTGAASTNAYVSFFQRTFGDWSNIFGGMQWKDALQDEIVLSGYHVDPGSPPGGGYPLLVRYGLATGSHWTRYTANQFNGAAYAGISFDHVVDPVNHIHPSSPFWINQRYYHPKSLVMKRTGPGYVFAAPFQDPSTGYFGLSLINTGQDGSMSCSEEVFGLDESAPLTSPNNFVGQAYNFTIAGQGAQVYAAGLFNDLECQGAPRPLNSNDVQEGYGIKLYPNPASDVLHISGLPGMGNSEIMLYDMQGRIVLSTQHGGKEASLDVSSLESGVYFLKVLTSEGKVFVEWAILR